MQGRSRALRPAVPHIAQHEGNSSARSVSRSRPRHPCLPPYRGLGRGRFLLLAFPPLGLCSCCCWPGTVPSALLSRIGLPSGTTPFHPCLAVPCLPPGLGSSPGVSARGPLSTCLGFSSPSAPAGWAPQSPGASVPLATLTQEGPGCGAAGLCPAEAAGVPLGATTVV